MRVAKVIGNIWATRKEDRLKGLKLLLVQSINPLDGSCDRVPFVAADIIGAATCSNSIPTKMLARSLPGDMSIPVDATVVGIVDGQDVDVSVLTKERKDGSD